MAIAVECQCHVRTTELTSCMQVIKGLDIKDGGFQTFGYSVSGGMDIDGNNYPDVVVGSLDERIAVLRYCAKTCIGERTAKS